MNRFYCNTDVATIILNVYFNLLRLYVITRTWEFQYIFQTSLDLYILHNIGGITLCMIHKM